MALTTVPLPYGLRDVQIFPLSGETLGTAVDLPNAQKFSFSEAEDTTTLRGDDGVVAVHGLGSTVSWELDSGGVSLEAVKAMYGGTLTTTGSTPSQVKTITKTDIDERPYFCVEGQAISDSGGDVHIKLFRAKATGELSGEMADSAFWITGAKGTALGRESDRKMYEFSQNETTTAIDTTP